MRQLLATAALIFLLQASCLAAPPQPDADMRRLLAAWREFGGHPVETMSVDRARSQPSLASAVRLALKQWGKPQEPQSVANVHNTTVPGAVDDLVARVYTPAGQGPFPVLVYFHGGGWVLGSIEDVDASARALANSAGCVVVSVGYRQAPEHPYPAALLDAYSAFSFISKNAKDYDGDPRRVAIGGEGSGANLAAAVCLRTMDLRGRQPVHQLLVCPIANFAFDTYSYRQNASARPYSRSAQQWFFKHYAPKKSTATGPYVSILRKSAIDLPSATVIVAELDPLRSDGEAYHKHLLDGAVDSQIGAYTGVTADFFGAGAVVAKGKKAVAFAGKRLRKAFTINRPGADRPKRQRTRKPKTPKTPAVQAAPAPAPAPVVPVP